MLLLNEFFGSVFTTENVADMLEVIRLFNGEDSKKLNNDKYQVCRCVE